MNWPTFTTCGLAVRKSWIQSQRPIQDPFGVLGTVGKLLVRSDRTSPLMSHELRSKVYSQNAVKEAL